MVAANGDPWGHLVKIWGTLQQLGGGGGHGPSGSGHDHIKGISIKHFSMYQRTVVLLIQCSIQKILEDKPKPKPLPPKRGSQLEVFK